MTPGTRLGPYEILALLGAGGMGEVYRGRDTKLHRDVALKVLPGAVAHDPERLARFRREAQVLAALNHPNIAYIHGLEESNDSIALVMELVDGSTLADRIALGPIPLEEALGFARQIAEALEYAHEHGIVHRDLKPANIKVTPDGTVKVLDFGLAKALTESSADASAMPANSPTLSIAATRAGVILGTAAYMSPEQAAMRPTDRRSDIWSFGVVLWELLAGKRLFEAETASHTLADVLRAPIDFGLLPASAPAPIKELLQRCLERNIKNRLQAIGEARIAIEKHLANPAPAGAAVAAPPAQAVAAPSSRLPWAVASGLAVTMVAAALLVAPRLSPRAPADTHRVSIDLGADVPILLTAAPTRPAFDVSRDGSMIVFVGGNTEQRLYLRRMNQLKATELGGTDGAVTPFFSPDGQWIAFFAQNKLKKIFVNGGAPLTLADAPEPMGASWSDDGAIYYSPHRTSPIMRVPAAGGTAQAVTTIGKNEAAHRWVHALPGGKAILYDGGIPLNFDQANVLVKNLITGEAKVLEPGAFYPRYLDSGHLVYIRESTLFAAPFSLEKLQITGPAVPVVEGIYSQPSSGAAYYAASGNGSLFYLAGGAAIAGRMGTLAWLDKLGAARPLRDETALYSSPRVSPDGNSVAVMIPKGSSGGADLWVLDLERGSGVAITHDAEAQFQRAVQAPSAVWTPDGRRLTFLAVKGGIFWRPADGTGQSELLAKTAFSTPGSWHPDGKHLVVTNRGGTEELGISLVTLPGDGSNPNRNAEISPLIPGRYDHVNACFSPDGRWIAYASAESGRFDVFVSPYPGPGGRFPISVNGGTLPSWSKNGKELYFQGRDNRIMEVSYEASGENFRAGQPRVWSETPVVAYDPHPDGKRMVVITPQDTVPSLKRDRLVMVTGFFAELARVGGK